MERLESLITWLSPRHPEAASTVTPASADASFRRYFRFQGAGGTLVAMDAPPEKEDCRPFVNLAGHLARLGLRVPTVLEWEPALGFMVLTDLGRTTYFDAVNRLHTTGSEIERLYRAAFLALVTLQSSPRPEALPDYDRALLMREIGLFPDWYVTRHLGQSIDAESQAQFDGIARILVDALLLQPQVLVHRDYHSRNLMVCDPGPGILDFQDAVWGPVTYDAVSLLRDAYLDWEEDWALDQLIRYWEQARSSGIPVAADFGAFYRDFEWMGVQRHLKVLGIFARLYHRDGKSGYLADMPRVAGHLHRTCRRYRELAPLAHWLERLWNLAPQEGYTF